MSKQKIFISYSHNDEKWKDEVIKHLKVLHQEDLLPDTWDDRRITVGQEWLSEILTAIESAVAAILIVSVDFLSSPFITKEEIPRLLKRKDEEGIPVFPLIVRDCSWRKVKWLSSIQVRPKDGRPISEGSETQIEKDLKEFAEEIADIIVKEVHPNDEALKKLHTDAEELLKIFEELVTTSILPKRILNIHGIGGVGKTTLLRMFRIYCKAEKIPVALVSGDEVKKEVDVIRRFIKDLENNNAELQFSKRVLSYYQAINNKVEVEIVRSKVSDEAFNSWIQGFLHKDELDLYRNPGPKLTEAFLNDVVRISQKNRCVLMIDAYEKIGKMIELDKWVRDIVQRFQSNILLVIAGRVAVGGVLWDEFWPEWVTQIYEKELKEMTDQHTRMLIHRYYSNKCPKCPDEPDPSQVEEIIHFTKGLPLAATIAVIYGHVME